MPVLTESEILAQCYNWLLRNGVFCWRNNTGAHKTEAGHYVRYGAPGSPDIIGILPNGRFIGVEIKSAKGKQSKDQKIFQRRVEKWNGIYIIARSIDDCEKFIKPLLTDEPPL